MKQLVLLLSLTFFCPLIAQSNRQIAKDFDGDKIKDTVYIDSDLDKLVCLLSSNNFKKIESLKIRSLNFGNTLVETKNGFQFWNDYGRSGWINEFEYNAKEKKMQLIKIYRTDYDIDRQKYGEAVKNGSGKSSIDLRTNRYVGNFYDVHDGKLRQLPTIIKQLVFTDTFLYCFSDDINFEFENKCLKFYEKAKKKVT